MKDWYFTSSIKIKDSTYENHHSRIMFRIFFNNDFLKILITIIDVLHICSYHLFFFFFLLLLHHFDDDNDDVSSAVGDTINTIAPSFLIISFN